ELLQHRAVPAVPALAPKAVEMAFEVLDVVAELHARAAHAEARFDHGRKPDRGERAAAHERRSWVRHACAGQPERGCELVARGEDSRRRIQDEDPARNRPAELVEPPLDPGEARPYGQAPEHDVADAG